MRIGVMLRAYDRPGGIGVYSRNILKHLLELDRANQYVLIYNDVRHLGTYADHANVEEVWIPATNPVIWDQYLTARVIKKRSIDLIFHTKFTVPVAVAVKKVMVLHGASWFVHPELYGRFDLFYVRCAMPVYCRQADFLIANSERTAEDFVKILNVPRAKIRTVPLAAGDDFVPVLDPEVLERARARYRLPRRFILTVASHDPRKNIPALVDAFELVRGTLPDVELVIVGKACHRYAADLDLSVRGLDKVVHFPGWIDQGELPAIYSLASVLAFPSVYEEFGIPVIEAMACGCPVVAADTGALPELTGGAALLAPPFDHHILASHLLDVLSSPATAEWYRVRGLERARQFSWARAGRETLDVFERVAQRPRQTWAAKASSGPAPR